MYGLHSISRGISSSNSNLTDDEQALWAHNLIAGKVREAKMDTVFLKASQCTKFLGTAISKGANCYILEDFDHVIMGVCFGLMCLKRTESEFHRIVVIVEEILPQST